VIIAFLCYANTLGNGFVYDDDQQILQNPYVKSWHYLPQIFGSTVWTFQGQVGTSNYYRPLMTFTFLLLWQIFGPLPFGFHLLNVVLHAVVVVLVYFSGKTIFEDRRIGWLSALLFAVHPIHTEVVAWAACIPDIEATALCLLALWLYSRRVPTGWKDHLGVIACFLFALLAKEPALMLAPLLVAYEHWVRKDNLEKTFLTKMARYLPLCAAAILYLSVRFFLFGSLAPVLQKPKLGWPQTIYSAFAGVWSYTKFLIWPTGLSAFHVFRPANSLLEPSVIAGLLVVVICGLSVILLRKKQPTVAFCILWIGATLAPVLNARWLASNVIAERYLYLPSVGFCWLFGWLAAKLWQSSAERATAQKGLRPAMASALVALVLLSAAKTVARNSDWRDDLTLYTKTLQTDSDASYIRTNLGVVYYDRKQKDLARKEWERALADKPDSVPTLTNLGLVYTELGSYDEAANLLQRAIQLKPLFPDAHYDYGILLDKTGRKDEALEQFGKAAELSPLNPLALRWYATELAATGKLPEAEVQFKRSIELAASPEALHGLAALYLQTGQNNLAEKTLRQLVRTYSYDSTGHLELAKLLEASGRQTEAKAQYEAVLLTDPANTEAKSAIQRVR
jgi:tetratricopeptide (TPR) repeat protein